MTLHPSVAEHLEDIRALAKKYGVAKLEIFGSAMTPGFDVDRSDVDFLVHYPPGYDFGFFLKHYQDLETDLTEVLNRPAQLVMTKALQKPYFKAVADTTRTTIYVDGENESLAKKRPNPLSIHR